MQTLYKRHHTYCFHPQLILNGKSSMRTWTLWKALGRVTEQRVCPSLTTSFFRNAENDLANKMRHPKGGGKLLPSGTSFFMVTFSSIQSITVLHSCLIMCSSFETWGCECLICSWNCIVGCLAPMLIIVCIEPLFT